MPEIVADHLRNQVGQLVLAVEVPQPDLDERLLLVLVEAEPDHIIVEPITDQAEEQVLPDLVQHFGLVVLLGVLELEQQTTAVLPGLPGRFAVLLEEHDLHVDFALRRQLHGGVVQEKLLESAYGGYQVGFMVLLIFGLRVDAPPFGVQAPSLYVQRTPEAEGVLSARKVRLAGLNFRLHLLYPPKIL